MTDKFPYKLIDSTTEAVVGRYAAKTIALRDCEAKNRASGLTSGRRFYVLKPSGGKVTA